jgi:hypothetical protein
VRLCAGEKRAITSLNKHVKHGSFESRIGGVSVCFPAAIEQIDLDAAGNWFAAIYSNCSITKIRSSFAVPRAELDNVDLVSAGADKAFAEISGKPARLQLQLRWNSRCDEQGAFAHSSRVAHLRIALYERAHPRIMRRVRANVTYVSGVYVSGERRLPACRSRQLAETGKWRRLRITRPKMLPAGLPATTGWQPVLPR